MPSWRGKLRARCRPGFAAGDSCVITLRQDVLAVSRACGVPHPSLITADQLELLDDRFGAKTVAELFGYGRGFGLPSPTDCDEVRRLMNV